MEHTKKALEKILFLGKQYETDLLEDDNLKNQILKIIISAIQEDISTKTVLKKEDLEILESSDFSRFEELKIFSQPCMTLRKMRERTNLLGCVILPISFSNCKAEGQDIQNISDKIGMKTYVLTSLENYNVWNEVISSSEVGGKYFPDKFMSVLLSVELMLGTQKNLYQMVGENREKIRFLGNVFNENMKNVVKTFQQLSRNQKKLLERSEYLMTEIANVRFALDREMYLLKAGEEGDRYPIRVRDTLRMWDYAAGPFLYNPDANDYDGELHWLRRQQLENALERDHLKRIGNIACEHLYYSLDLREKWKQEVRSMTPLEEVKIPKIVEVEIKKEFETVIKVKKIIENKGGMVFHTFASDIAEEEGFIFLNSEEAFFN